MRSIDIRPRLFLGEPDRERSERAMHYILHALCCIDYEYLKRYGAPALYKSGVRYDNARAGKKEWQDTPETMRRRLGDCKDLACWLVAEDWTRGVRSRPFIRYRVKQFQDEQGRTRYFSLYHVLVQRPDGTLEDPSARLGMGNDEWAPMESHAAGEERPDERDAGAPYVPPPLSQCVVPSGVRCDACGRSCACGNWCCCAGEPTCPGAGAALGAEPFQGFVDVWASSPDPYELPAMSPASAWAYRNVPAMNRRNVSKGDEPGYLPMAATLRTVIEEPAGRWGT